MTFEEFEKTIWSRGYGIVAFNHYTISGERRTYCVILNRDATRAFKAEAADSPAVFDEIVAKMEDHGGGGSSA